MYTRLSAVEFKKNQLLLLQKEWINTLIDTCTVVEDEQVRITITAVIDKINLIESMQENNLYQLLTDINNNLQNIRAYLSKTGITENQCASVIKIIKDINELISYSLCNTDVIDHQPTDDISFATNDIIYPRRRRQLEKRGIKRVENSKGEQPTFRYIIKDVSLNRQSSTSQIRDLKKYSFKDIVDYIKGCEAFKSGCNIEISETEIKIGISLQELQASFPLIFTFFNPKKHKIVTEKTFSEFSTMLSDCEWKSVTNLEDEQSKLLTEAEMYFRNLENNNIKPIKSIKSLNDDQPSNTILNILDNNQCLIIGEKHEDPEPKKQLIENMAELKKKGLTHIFLEHLLLDTQEQLLLKYFNSETSFENIPVILQEYLSNLDKNFGLHKNGNLYNFLNLLIEAKKQGIKVVAIDTAASYSIPINERNFSKRCAAMNYVFAKQLNKAVNDSFIGLNKYIVLCGSRHINNINSYGVPGVDAISGGVTLVIENVSDETKFKSANEHVANPDVLIQVSANNKHNTSINTSLNVESIKHTNDEILIQPLLSIVQSKRKSKNDQTYLDKPSPSITPAKEVDAPKKTREKSTSQRKHENVSQTNLFKSKKTKPANDIDENKLKIQKSNTMTKDDKKRIKLKSHKKISKDASQFLLFENKKEYVNDSENKKIKPLTNMNVNTDMKKSEKRKSHNMSTEGSQLKLFQGKKVQAVNDISTKRKKSKSQSVVEKKRIIS